MKISTRGRYALRLMLELAMHYEESRFLSIKGIAEHQHLSEKYLEQIVTRLGRTGLVESARGPAGGYRLTRPPATYTVGEILRIMEGDLGPVSDINPDLPPSAVSYVWDKLSAVIDSVVDTVTLADLVKMQRQIEVDSNPSEADKEGSRKDL